MCIFACLEEIEQCESHQRVPEIRSGDKIFWLLWFHCRQRGDCLRQPEKFQLLVAVVLPTLFILNETQRLRDEYVFGNYLFFPSRPWGKLVP